MLLLKHSPRLLAFCLLAKISTAAAIDPLRVGGSSQNLIRHLPKLKPKTDKVIG